MDSTWFLQKNKFKDGSDVPTLYVRACVPTGKRDRNGRMTYKGLLMHKFVTNSGDGAGIHVDHLDHNGLNNRKGNLRVVPAAKNLVNRKSKNKNNKSGYRNVFWSEKEKRWVVSLHKNGKQIWGGQYKDVHEAGRVAAELRKKYYGEYSEAS